MQRHRSTPLRRHLRILVCLALLLIAGAWYWAHRHGGAWLDRTVRERIETAVRKATVGGYHFTMDSLRTDVRSGDILIRGIRLTYDPALNDSLSAGVYAYLFSAHAHTIALRGASLWRAVLLREIHLRSVEVDTPAFEYTIGDHRVPLEAPLERLARPGRNTLDLFDVGDVVVRGARARMHDLSGHLPVLYTSGLDLHVRRLRVLRPGDQTRADLSVAAVDVRLDSLTTNLPGGYRLRFGESHLSDHLRFGTIRHIALERIDALAPPYRTTRNSVAIDSIVLADLDVARLIGDRSVNATTVTLYRPTLRAELDKDRPEGPARNVMLPPAALLDLPFPILVDSLLVIDGAVLYRERSDQTGLWGALRLGSIQARCSGITNTPRVGSEPPVLRANLHCQFMDTTRLDARYEARLDGSADFSFFATLNELPLSSLDSLTTNLLRLSITQGRVEHLVLEMHGDAEKARGTMEMKYADVVTTVASNASPEQRRNMLGSVMEFVLAEPLGGGLSDHQRRSVSVDRDANRSLFTYIWHFTRAGIKRDLKPGATQRLFSILKKERDVRRARRQTRKATS